jgi:hypothetical protein
MKRSYFLFLLQRFYFYYGKKSKIFEGCCFNNCNKKKEKEISKKFFRNFLEKRNRYLRVLFLKNPLILYFFKFNIDLKNILGFILNLKKYKIIKTINFFIEVIKKSKLILKLKLFLIKKLVIKNNKLILKLVYYFWLLTFKSKEKKELISSFFSFINFKKELISSFLKLNSLLLNKKFNKLYFLSILYKIERKYSLLNFKIKNFIYSKKKRYKFISFFLWIYKIFNNISFTYWLNFLIFWLRSFVFFYFNLIFTTFPQAKNLRRIVIYSLYFFVNYSNMLILEKKYFFKIYNKIINHFYVLRKFSFFFNYSFFKKINFQQVKEIPFFKDFFSHWHLNLNRLSKFINIHYNEYLYSYINKFFFKEKNLNLSKNNLLLKKMQNRYYKSVDRDISFFTFNRLKKNENLKYVFFSKNLKLDKINFFFNLRTKIKNLNKHLVYPTSLQIADLYEEAKEEAKRKVKWNDDLRLQLSSNKLERLMFLRKKARNLIIQKKKFKKIRKKIRIFGEDEVEDFSELESLIENEEEKKNKNFVDFLKISKNIEILKNFKNDKEKKSTLGSFLPFVCIKKLNLKRTINNDDRELVIFLISKIFFKEIKGVFSKELTL